MSITKEDVKKYRELFGEWLVPIKEDKKPKSIRTGKNGVDGSWKWYDTEKKIFLKWSDEELIGAAGLGVSLEPSNLIAVDGDMVETSPFMSELPETFTIGKKVNGKTLIRQKLYKSEIRPKYESYGKGTDDGCCVELLVNTQSVFIGGDRIILDDRKPTVLSNGSLEHVQETTRQIYSWAMLSRKYPPAGKKQRDNYIYTLTGAFANQNIMPLNKRKEFVQKLLHANGDTKEVQNRMKKIERQQEKFDRGEAVLGLPALTELLGAEKHVGLPFIDVLKPKPKTAEDEKGFYKTSTLAEFQKREYPPVKFLIQNLLTDRTFNMISGGYGSGKTHVGLALALSLATGHSFFHHKVHEPISVLYVEAELPATGVQDRISSIRAGGKYLDPKGYFNIITRDDLVLAGREEGFKLIATEDEEGKLGRKFIENTALEIKKRTGMFPCIFLDNFTALSAVDENSAKDWQPLIHWFIKIKNKYGAAHQLFHHLNKGSGKKRSASGSNYAQRLCDEHFIFEELGEDERFESITGKAVQSRWSFDKKRNIPAEHNKTFIFTMTEEGEHKTYPNLHKIDFTIMNELKEKNIDQIIEDHKDEKGWGKSTIYRRVAKLKKQGVI